MLRAISLASLLSVCVLTTTTHATPPTSPHNVFVRQASECVAATGGVACPGDQYCCPMLWECKANEPSLCTASLGPGQALTVSAIDWGAAMASVSRDIATIRSRISEAAASITGGARMSVSPERVTATSSPGQSAPVVSEGGPVSSGAESTGASTSPTRTIQSSPSIASATAATTSATGGATMPTMRKELMMGGLVGMALFLV